VHLVNARHSGSRASCKVPQGIDGGSFAGARSASTLRMDKGTRDVGSTSASANRALQDNLDRNEPRIVASYALIGAILVLGSIGFAIDRWAGTSPWLLLVGLAAGILLGLVQLLRSVRQS
jgi:F0F1-type ATP synthase assembly protein I